MSKQHYEIGCTYCVINSRTMVFENVAVPNLGLSHQEFHEGYMLSGALIDPFPRNVICLQVFEKYIQFLWGEKTIWIFKLDADACLRPLFSGYNQIK